MKRITFEVSDSLLKQIDEAGVKDGFNGRSEFLRFLIVTYLKKEHPHRNKDNDCEFDSNDKSDEFANIDCEYGIPPEVIKKLEIEAKLLSENERQKQS